MGEELGVTGLLAIILIYGLIVARGFQAALGARDPFGKLLATGLSFVFAVQVFAILGGVTRLLPLTGLTTPFMSQGGSSLVANWIMVALLLVITHQVRRPAVNIATMPVASLEGDTTELIEVGSLAGAAPAPAAPQVSTPDADAPLVHADAASTAEEETAMVPSVDTDDAPATTTQIPTMNRSPTSSNGRRIPNEPADPRCGAGVDADDAGAHDQSEHRLSGAGPVLQ